MERIDIDMDLDPDNLEAARKIAEKAMDHLDVDSPMLLAWHDRGRDIHSPVSVCCEVKGVPGWEAYAINRGARFRVSIGDDAYVLLYA